MCWKDGGPETDLKMRMGKCGEKQLPVCGCLSHFLIFVNVMSIYILDAFFRAHSKIQIKKKYMTMSTRKHMK